MISREFIYKFSKFDDIKSCENDKKSRAEALKSDEMGVSYKFEGDKLPKGGLRRPVREGFGAGRGTRLLHSY